VRCFVCVVGDRPTDIRLGPTAGNCTGFPLTPSFWGPIEEDKKGEFRIGN
jgi:hypothetical protein